MASNLQKIASLFILVLFAMVSFWTVITQGIETQWGWVYIFVFLMSMVFVTLSFIKISEGSFEYEPINEGATDSKNFFIQVAIGIGLGILLVSSVLIGTQSFLSPLKIPQVLGFLGWSAIGQVIIISIFVSEFEETFRSATLRPSLVEWLQSVHGRVILLFISGFLLWGLVAGSFSIVGLFLMGLAALSFILYYYLRNNVLEKFFENKHFRTGFAIIFSAIFFSILHWAAYRDPLDPVTTLIYLSSAFMFAVIADVFATMFKSTVVGRTAHTLNNGTVACVNAGVPIPFAFVVTGIHVFLMLVTSKVKRG